MNQEIKLKNPRLDVGDYFDIGWEIFKDNLSSFLVLALFIDLPLGILQLFVPTIESVEEMAEISSTFVLIFAILNIVLSLIGFLSSSIITESAVLNQSIEIASAIKQGLARVIPSLLVAVVGTILVSIGFILLIVPGIYLANLLYFSLYAVALRGRSLDAFPYSRDLVKGQWWKIFGRGLLIGLGFAIVTFVLMFVFGFGTVVFSAIPFGGELVSIVGTVVTGLLGYLFVAVVTVFFLNVDYVRHQN